MDRREFANKFSDIPDDDFTIDEDLKQKLENCIQVKM
jgi:hypothetical protein